MSRVVRSNSPSRWFVQPRARHPVFQGDRGRLFSSARVSAVILAGMKRILARGSVRSFALVLGWSKIAPIRAGSWTIQVLANTCNHSRIRSLFMLSEARFATAACPGEIASACAVEEPERVGLLASSPSLNTARRVATRAMSSPRSGGTQSSRPISASCSPTRRRGHRFPGSYAASSEDASPMTAAA